MTMPRWRTILKRGSRPRSDAWPYGDPPGRMSDVPRVLLERALLARAIDEDAVRAALIARPAALWLFSSRERLTLWRAVHEAAAGRRRGAFWNLARTIEDPSVQLELDIVDEMPRTWQRAWDPLALAAHLEARAT